MTGGEVWRRGWFWAALALLSTLPFIIAPLPMMPDFFTHTARYHVMNHGADSPFLPQYFAFRWALVGNLGVDLLMVPLGQMLPTEAAARLAAALIPLLTIAGLYAVATAAWGRIEAPALLALPFALSFSFLFGFVNYHLAVALALLVLALWIHAAGWPGWRRWLVFVPLGLLVWAAHIAGWAVLLVAAGGWELAARRRPLAAGLRLLPLLAPLLPTLVWRSGDAPALVLTWHNKLVWVLIALRAEWQWLDLATLTVLMAAALLLLRAPAVRRAPGLLLAAAVLLALFLAVPNSLFGSNFADQRLLAPLAMLCFLGLAIPDRRQAQIVAGLGIALFTLRLGEISIGWHQRGTAAVADLAALNSVPNGARIALAAPPSDCAGWPMTGFDHLASLAIVRRDAFVNTAWDLEGALLMRPIYNRGFGFNDTSSTIIAGPACPANRGLASWLERLPRQRFDYVWVFGPDRPGVPWLQKVHDGPDGSLYRITTHR